jgi:hypothetical protein
VRRASCRTLPEPLPAGYRPKIIWILEKRRARRLAELDQFRVSRRATDEDVTVLGEQLGELHVDTLRAEFDDEMRADYQRALDAYDKAKLELSKAATTADVAAVNVLLDDGRFARACVLARRDGEELPQRRESCFFNPQHGPAAMEVEWKPWAGSREASRSAATMPIAWPTASSHRSGWCGRAPVSFPGTPPVPMSAARERAARTCTGRTRRSPAITWPRPTSARR